MRVFVDTNIVISAMLFPNGKVAKVFSHILEKHTLIISSYTKEECTEVFEKKFPSKIKQLEIFFDGINFEEFKSPEKIDEKKYPKIRDIKDLPVSWTRPSLIFIFSFSSSFSPSTTIFITSSFFSSK